MPSYISPSFSRPIWLGAIELPAIGRRMKDDELGRLGLGKGGLELADKPGREVIGHDQIRLERPFQVTEEFTLGGQVFRGPHVPNLPRRPRACRSHGLRSLDIPAGFWNHVRAGSVMRGDQASSARLNALGKLAGAAQMAEPPPAEGHEKDSGRRRHAVTAAPSRRSSPGDLSAHTQLVGPSLLRRPSTEQQRP
jgi:hypothetical protein